MKLRELLRGDVANPQYESWHSTFVSNILRLFLKAVLAPRQRIPRQPTHLPETGTQTDTEARFETLLSRQFAEYHTLDGESLPALVKKLDKKIITLPESEQCCVIVIGSPGSGKSELIARLRNIFLSKGLSADATKLFTWEGYAEHEFRASLPEPDRSEPKFSDENLKKANFGLPVAFKKFIQENPNLRLVFAELPISNAIPTDPRDPATGTDPEKWQGRLMGELLLWKIIHNHYPQIHPFIIAAYPGPGLLYEDAVRVQGAPYQIVRLHHSHTHVSIEKLLASGSLQIPAYTLPMIGPESIDAVNLSFNPLSSSIFERKFGDNIRQILSYILPSSLSFQDRLRIYRRVARLVALSEARGIFMAHLLNNLYKATFTEKGKEILPVPSSVVMVMPTAAQLKLDPQEAHTAFTYAVHPPKKKVK